MLFPTLEFFTFFTVILILNWNLKRWPLAWRLFLLLSSYFFYSLWDFRFLIILFSVSLFNFFIIKLIDIDFWGRRKWIFIFSIATNISVLGLYKYYDFFRVSAEDLLSRFGVATSLPLLEIILPVGLSFYILRAVSCNIDIYLKKITPVSSVLDFFIYISFFPQILSGPIDRAGNFLPQLKDGGAGKIENLNQNLVLIILGLFKKIVFSNYLSTALVAPVVAIPQNYSFEVVILAVFSYSLVIYFDFSGYSDMAIGFAGLMGFKSPLNFDSPYLALDIRSFWRKWHMSLSSWVRDYIYVPLGGNRKGTTRKYANLMATMLVVGLWHGAALHFVIWGAIQGFGLVVSNALAKKLFEAKKVFQKFLLWTATFIFVSVSWVFFFSETTKDAFDFFRYIFSFEEGRVDIFSFTILACFSAGLLLVLLEKQIFSSLVSLLKGRTVIFLIFFFILAFIVSMELSGDQIPNFIYFSF
ncbi:MAG: MBOAT family protein [Candidatus Pacebacteria bacterium]|nr:MBOAT family protein [Candidatus Paceibacterota bacterium]